MSQGKLIIGFIFVLIFCVQLNPQGYTNPEFEKELGIKLKNIVDVYKSDIEANELHGIPLNANTQDSTFTIIVNNVYGQKIISLFIEVNGKTIEKYEDKGFTGLTFYSERGSSVLGLDTGLRYNVLSENNPEQYTKIINQYKRRLNSILKLNKGS